MTINTERMSMEQLEKFHCAAALYDGGWRAEDKAQLIGEYGITEEEAVEICEYLAEFEEREAQE